jgi:hypothetical protein
LLYTTQKKLTINLSDYREGTPKHQLRVTLLR